MQRRKLLAGNCDNYDGECLIEFQENKKIGLRNENLKGYR